MVAKPPYSDAAVAYPVGVMPVSSTGLPGCAARRAAISGCAARISPTDTEWTHSAPSCTAPVPVRHIAVLAPPAPQQPQWNQGSGQQQSQPVKHPVENQAQFGHRRIVRGAGVCTQARGRGVLESTPPGGQAMKILLTRAGHPDGGSHDSTEAAEKS